MKPTARIITTALFMLLISISIASALTIEELIDSTVFDYDGEKLNITSLSDVMTDTNSNGKNDTLTITINVDIDTAGTYNFFIDLEETYGVITNNNSKSFSTGSDSIDVAFDSKLFNQVNHTYNIRVYDSDYMLAYRKDNQVTNTYPDYERGVNITSITDENVNNDFIRINLTLNVTDSQTSNVTAYLMYNDSYISSSKQEALSAGLQTVSIYFDNETIKATHYAGSFTLDLVTIGNKSISENYSTAIYDYEDFAKTSYIKNFTSGRIDTNANNLSEFLEINITLDVKSDDTLELKGELYDLSDNYVINFSKTEGLTAGINNIQLRINGSDIYSTYIDGPYVINHIELLDSSDNLMDYLYQPYITNITSYFDYEPPPLPDLVVAMTNVSWDSATNAVSIALNISNIGNAPAFVVFTDLFDNSTYTSNKTKSYLNISDSFSYNFTVNNVVRDREFLAIVDLGNYVDESNESNNIANLTLVINGTAPQINLISATPAVQEFGENVTLTANVTDEEGNLNYVFVSVQPNGEEGANYTMMNISPRLWQYKFTDFTNGTYNYTVYAVDTTDLSSSSSGTFEMFVDIYSNIKTLEDSYVDDEYVNITDPPEDAPVRESSKSEGGIMIVKDGSAWTILEEDSITKYLLFNFVYIDDYTYRVDWNWKNNMVKKVLRDCNDDKNIDKCIEDSSSSLYDKGNKTQGKKSKKLSKAEFKNQFFKDEDLTDVMDQFSYLNTDGLPKKVLKGNAEFEGDLNPLEEDKGSFYIHLDDGFYKSNGLLIKIGMNSTLVEFNNSKTIENLTYQTPGSKTRYLKLNSTATITSATIDLKGYEKWWTLDNFSVKSCFAPPMEMGADITTIDGSYFWISDPEGKVHKADSSGYCYNYTISFSSCPAGITTVDASYFWIADTYDYILDKANSALSHVSDWSTSDYSEWPIGVDTTDGNYFWIADNDFGVLYKFDSSGNYQDELDISSFTSSIEQLNIFDSNFWVIDGSTNIIKVNSGGSKILSFRPSDEFTNPSYSNPYGITDDGTDIWVYDSGEFVIYKIKYNHPTNITIDSSNDGSDDYTNLSSFSGSVDDLDLNVTAIQEFIDSCTPDAEGFCYVPIVFSSDTGGRLEYSDINITYEVTPPPDTESKIRNDGELNTSVYLLMKIQYWNGSLWLDESTIQDDGSTRRIEPGTVNQLKLDAIWNPNAWYTSSNTHGNGTYRVYVTATDENNVVLQNEDGVNITAVYNFTLVVNNSAPTFNETPVGQQASTGILFTYDLNASDIDGDTITYYLNDTSLFAIGDSSGIISGTPTESDIGTKAYKVTVGDGSVNSSAVFSIIINDATAPRYSNNQSNVTTFNNNDFIEINVTWTESNPAQAWFGNNFTGAWINDTPRSYTSGTDIGNRTQFTAGEGTTGCWYAYANDTAGNTNSTSLSCITSTITNTTQSALNITSFTERYSNENYHIFELEIQNYGETNLSNINFTVDFADSNSVHTTKPFNLTANESMMAYISYTYSASQDYTLTATAYAQDIQASKNLTIERTSDLEITSFTELYSFGKHKIWELIINNTGPDLTDINFNITGLETVITTTNPFNLTSNESIKSYIKKNLTDYQSYDLTAIAYTLNQSTQRTLATKGKQLEIHNFTTIYSSSLEKIFELLVTNTYISPISSINITFDTGEEIINSTKPFNLTQDENIRVILKKNYSSSGTYALNASVKSEQYEDSENKTIII